MVLPINEKFNADIIKKIPFKNMSVRSGGVSSLPGLMQSYLNVSLEDAYTKAQFVKESSQTPIVKEIASYLNVSPNTAVIFQEMLKLKDINGSGIIANYNPITHKKELTLSYKKMFIVLKLLLMGEMINVNTLLIFKI